mgnify:CR=1 FL=1
MDPIKTGRLIRSLRQKQGLTQRALAELIGMTQSAVSHQLRVLRDANLVACRRVGKTVYYSLADSHVASIVAQGFEHILERKEGEK